MKLYQLTDQYIKLEAMADGIDTPEDADAFATLWGEIAGAFEDKAEKTACVIRNLEAESKAIEDEEKRLRARRKALEGSADRLKGYLEHEMVSTGLTKITGKLFTMAMQKNPPSLRVDADLLPDEWWVVKREVDNSRVKDALKAGQAVDGAWLEQGQSLRIR